MADEEDYDVIDLDDLYADLGGVSEVAETLNVKKFRVNRWIERRDSTRCPTPVRTISNGHIYRLSHWREWFALWSVSRGHGYTPPSAPDREPAHPQG